MAVTAARGLGRLSLEDALALTLTLTLTELFARTADSRFETAAVKLLARLADERRPTLGGMRIAVEALVALPDESAQRVPRELVRRR